MQAVSAASPAQSPLCQADLKAVLHELTAKVNSSALRTIYTYAGDDRHKPIYYEETKLFIKMVQQAGLDCRVVEVSDRCFTPETWDPETSVLHIPGAMSSALDEHLGDKVPAIKQFVQKGGKIWGWCGGGYWLCHRVEYRISETETMVKIRHLDFWKGTQAGPLMPYLGNPEGNVGFFHGAVKVKWQGSDALQMRLPEGLETNVLLSGGGSLIPSDEEHPYKELAHYSEYPAEKSLSAVKTRVGKGMAVIVNTYFTHGDDYFRAGLEGYKRYFPDHPWDKIVTDLTGNKEIRMICFVDMLAEMFLGVEDG